MPPLSGAYTDPSKGAIEVIISKPVPIYFASLFLATPPTAKGRAVVQSAGALCLLTTQSTGSDITTSGPAGVTLKNCDLYDNSTSTPDVTMSGSGTVTARDAYLSGGGPVLSGSTSFCPAPCLLHLDTAPIADPYANRSIPTFSGCNATSPVVTASKTYTAVGSTPYVICNGMTLAGSGTLTFGAGVYVINKGNITSSGTWNINATAGTTLIFTSSTGSGIGTIIGSGSPP